MADTGPCRDREPGIFFFALLSFGVWALGLGCAESEPSRVSVLLCRHGMYLLAMVLCR